MAAEPLKSRLQPLRSPWFRVTLGLALFALCTVAVAMTAYPSMFYGFGPYDDEGYVLLTLKSFLAHGNLYDDVFSQYGPFFYEIWGGLFSGLGIAVDHEHGRIVTLVVWLGTSLLAGLATWRMTRSLLLGLATQLLVFLALGSMVSEPMHPGGLIALLLSFTFALAVASQSRWRVPGMLLLGACVGALGLVKVNIGVFALLSTAVACAATYPALGAWKRSRLAAELMFVAVPFVLVARDLGQSESRSFALHVSIAALAAVVALRGLQPDRSRDWRELRWLLGGVGGAAAMICVGIIAAGTSPGGLVEGVVIDPSKLPSVLGVGGPRIPAGVLVLDVFALAACLGWRRLSAQGRLDGAAWRVAAPLSSIGVGVLVGLTAAQVSIPLLGADPGAGGPTADRFLPLALAWIALIPPRAADQGMAFAGRLLVALAVLQALHAYPVAGTQTQWGSFLLVPVGAFCVANGLRDLPLLATAQRARRSLILAAGVIPLAMAWWALDQAVLGRLEDGREGYRAGVPIALAGTGSIHFDARHVRIYRRVSEAIIDDCRTFLSLPGLNSFYLWTEIDPPTLLNTTQWMYLFDRDTERRVVQQSERVDGLCLLKSPMVLRFWTGDDPPPNGPLLRFMREEFKPIYRFGGYELLRRASG